MHTGSTFVRVSSATELANICLGWLRHLGFSALCLIFAAMVPYKSRPQRRKSFDERDHSWHSGVCSPMSSGVGYSVLQVKLQSPLTGSIAYCVLIEKCIMRYMIVQFHLRPVIFWCGSNSSSMSLVCHAAQIRVKSQSCVSVTHCGTRYNFVMSYIERQRTSII